MGPYYADESVTLYYGDCLDVLRELPDSSVDSVVTDPPYGLEFMGREWDGADGFRRSLNSADAGRDNVFGRTSRKSPEYRALHTFQEWCQQWATECLRILKPGGHLVAFGGSRTWHRLASAVEDAGFEIRDSIAWLYSSGFPKSLNVGHDSRFCQCGDLYFEYGTTARVDTMEQVRASDMPGLFDGVSQVADEVQEQRSPADMLTSMPRHPRSGLADGDCGQGSRGVDSDERGILCGSDERGVESSLEGRSNAEAGEGELQGRPIRAMSGGVHHDVSQGWVRDGAPIGDGSVDRPATEASRSGASHRPQSGEQSSGEPGTVSVERGSQAGRGRPVCGRCGKQRAVGLGTALKPAFEPIVVGRKPLAGTVAQNVLTHGTGALNIDACRTATATADDYGRSTTRADGSRSTSHEVFGADTRTDPTAAHDRGRWPTNVVLDDSQAVALDEQSGNVKGAVSNGRTGKSNGYSGGYGEQCQAPGYGDSGGASRFFPTFHYEAKAPASERPAVNGVQHPTVKPLDLMRWLVRLVTPPNGVVLEPFAGSGTTAEACVLEHMQCIAIEREADYLPLITSRLTKPMQVGFDFGSA